MPKSSVCDIELAALLVQVAFDDGPDAFLIALHYKDAAKVPEATAARRSCFSDLYDGACRQVRLIGSVSQICDIVRAAEFAPDSNNGAAQIERLIQLAATNRTVWIPLDDQFQPKGTALKVACVLSVQGTAPKIARELRGNSSLVTFHLAPSWRIADQPPVAQTKAPPAPAPNYHFNAKGQGVFDF